MKAVIIVSMSVMVAALTAFAQDKTVSVDQEKMVANERAFAKLGSERGIRESFIRYFSPDCIVFAPDPVKYRAVLEAQPPEKFPLPVRVNWSPVWGDISAAGDMGWNTGPVVYDDTAETKRPPRHVVFFSVWKKQADGNWLVVLDVGTSVPSAVAPLDTPYQSLSTVTPKKLKRNVKKELANVLGFEDFKMGAIASSGMGAWKIGLDENVRFYRKGMMPVVGIEAVSAWLDTQKYHYSSKIMFSDISKSGDLAYVYGSASQGDENGHFVRVWRRDAKGAWWLAVDIFSPLPPAKKE